MHQRAIHRHFLIVVTLLALVAGILAIWSPLARASEGSGTVYGWIKNSDGDYLSGVTVDVFASDAGVDTEPVASMESSDGASWTGTGGYVFTLPAGDYRLRYMLEGYNTRWYGLGAGSVVSVADGAEEHLDQVTMTPASDAVIQGVIVDAEGFPVDDARVMAFADGESTPSATARTYAGGGVGHGYFALHVPAGTYEIRFSGPPWSTAYAKGIFPEDITVASGDSVDLGELALVEPGTVGLAGSVTSTDGRIEGVKVSLYQFADGSSHRASTRTDATGGYSFDRVPVGARVVVCAVLDQIQKCNNGRISAYMPGPRRLITGDDDPVEVRVIPFDLVHAHGSVVDPDGVGVPGARVDFWRDNGDGSFTRTYRTMSMEEGSFDRAMRRNGATFTACVSFREASGITCLGGETLHPRGTASRCPLRATCSSNRSPLFRPAAVASSPTER